MEMIEQIQQKTIQERIYLLELILNTLKHDLVETKEINLPLKTFQVRTFHLGEDVRTDRNLIYAERLV